MYGKHFASMYSGSMVGKGALMFAVMGYVIANMKPDVTIGTQVELNPKLLAMIIGEDEAAVERTINQLCEPDPESRSKEEGGRRLIRLGQFDYRVVNGDKYLAIKNEEERREYNRLAKQRERNRKKYGPQARERAYHINPSDDLLHDKTVSYHVPIEQDQPVAPNGTTPQP